MEVTAHASMPTIRKPVTRPDCLRCSRQYRSPRIICTSVTTPSSEPTRRTALATGAAYLGSVVLGNNLAAAAGPALAEAQASKRTSANQDIPLATVSPELEVSRVIRGCWQLSGAHRGDSATDRTSGTAAVEDIRAFVNSGINTLDCADHYGDAEAIIGRYQRSVPKEAKATVLTKACIWGWNLQQAGKGDTLEKEYIDVSRKRLNQSKLDLLQLYWHDYGQPQYVSAALKLVDMQQEGKLRNIGLTNFDVPRVQEIVDAGVPIVSHQVAYSLLDRRPQRGMADYCAEKNISLLPYGVVAGGLLSDKYLGVPSESVAFNTASKRKYAAVLSTVGGWSWFQRLLTTLHGIAARHEVSIANVASRWVLEQPAVGAIILGARNANHLDDHHALFGFSLDQADRDAIDEVLADSKPPAGDCYTWERGGVF